MASGGALSHDRGTGAGEGILAKAPANSATLARVGDLPAKLARPRLGAAVRRNRLHRALDDARDAGAVWVAGPPGSGKTTLLASWIEARRARAVWLELDASDADPATFFRDLELAARGAARRLRLPPLGPEYGAEVPLFSRNAFRKLYSALPRGTVVVLDDCHEVVGVPALDAVLRAAVEELVPGVALVLSSRAGPPAALARARVNGRLRVLGAAALGLTRAEALAIARARGFRGGAARVEPLRRAVNGWAAGLVLALAAAEDPDSELDLRSATLDYFGTEVFERADPATRRVLLEAALLDAPTGELVAEATGDPGAGRVLSGLARRGLFTFRRGPGAGAFEFHALFREFLLARGRDELPPGRADAVRRAAAASLAARGGADAEAAIALYLAAGAPAEAAAVVARAAAPALAEGRGAAVLRWIEALPPAVRDADPWVRCWEARALAPRAPAAARSRLEPALAQLEARGDAAGVWLAWTGLVESVLLEWSDFTALGTLTAELDRLHRAHPFPSPEIEAQVTLTALAVLAYAGPDHPELAPWAERGLALALAPGQASVRLMAGAYYVWQRAWWFGELERVRPLVAALGPLARAANADPAPAILWLAIEATTAAALGDAASAARAEEEARGLAAASGVKVWDVVLHTHAIWTALGDDDVGAARAALARIRAAIRPGNEMDRAFAITFEGMVALRAGDPAAAARLATEASDLVARRRNTMVESTAALLLSRALARTGGEAARAALAAARFRSPPFEHVLALVEAERGLASGDDAATSTALARALANAGAGNALARYFFSRAELAELVAEALRRGIAPDAARELVRTRRLSPPPGAGAEWPREVRIRALGGFAVERDGAPVGTSARGPQRTLELLRVLVALGGRDVPEERVAEALWPDSDGDAAQHALETAVYRLRRLLGRDAVVQRMRRLSISTNVCWVDALELDAVLAEGGDGPDPRRRAHAAAQAARVAQLYAGPLLAETDAPWAAAARDALRRRLLRWIRAQDGVAGEGTAAATLCAELGARDDRLGCERQLRSA